MDDNNDDDGGGDGDCAAFIGTFTFQTDVDDMNSQNMFFTIIRVILCS